MNPNGVLQARKRLDRAMKALDRLIAAETFDDVDAAWSDFLLASNGIYEKLEIGARGTRSEGWWSKKAYERKADPLLRYLHHARNADEHGLEPLGECAARLDFHGQGVARRLQGAEGREVVMITLDNPSLATREITFVLAPVKDRSRNIIEVPVEHMGEADDFHPIRASGVALGYLLRMVDEAAELSSR